MSDPKVIIEVSESGARKTEQAVKKVASAQTKVATETRNAAKETKKAAAASEQAAKAAERQTKAAEKQTKAAEKLSRAQETGARKAAAATSGLASSQSGAASSAADAATALGRQSAAMTALKAGATGAARAMSVLARVANLLPALGLSGAIMLVVKGFMLLAGAIKGGSRAAEGWVRISKAAAASTDAYAAALKQLPQLSSDATIAQVRLSQAVERTTNERAKYLSIAASAQDELRLADSEQESAEAALLNAKSIDAMKDANKRLRDVTKSRAEAANVLAFANIRLTHLEQQHRSAVEAATKAELARSQQMADTAARVREMSGALRGAAATALTVFAPGMTQAFDQVQARLDQQANRAFGAQLARSLGLRKPARSGGGRSGRDAEIDQQLAMMDLEYAGAQAQARGRADTGPPSTAMGDMFSAVTSGAAQATEAMVAYGKATGEAIAKAQAQRDAQVAMTNAMVASGQAYASAALSAVLYGGSVSEAINATARAAFVEGTVGALGALAKAAVFSVINPPGVPPMLAAAKMYGAQAAVAGALAAGTGGLTGGGGGSTAVTEPTATDFGEPERRERQDSEIFVNFASGQSGGRPPSRAEASAAMYAIIDLFRAGGLRLETSRA